MPKHQSPIVSTILLLALAGCSKATPGTTDLNNAVASRVPGYSVQRIDCKSFASKQEESAGRSSCAGTLTIDQDLYGYAPVDLVEKAVSAAGIPSEGVQYFISKHPKTIIAQVVKKGSASPFTAECSYAGGVNGWQVSCDSAYTKFNGSPSSALGSDAVLYGSPEFKEHLGEILSDYHETDAAFSALKGQIEQFFAPGKTIEVGNAYTHTPMVRAPMSSPVVWAGQKNFLGYSTEFYVDTKYQDLRDSPKQTFCGYAKGSPADDIRFGGHIEPRSANNSPEFTKPFVAYFEMMDRVQNQNQFQSCGNQIVWDGTAWRSPFSIFSR